MSRPPRPITARSSVKAPTRDARIPSGYRDAVIIVTDWTFPWADRIRILFGRPVQIRTLTWTEHKPGKLKTASTAIAAARVFRRRAPAPPPAE